MEIRPGDRVTFLDFEATERSGTVIMVGPRFTVGYDDPNDDFDVVVVDCEDQPRWCYPSQITEANSVAVEP